MKLGIVVVYLIKKENEGLLDLHLKQIEKFTNVPYTIYGSINRLLPEFRARVEHHPKVKICQVPTTPLRSDEEQVFYLEHLVKEAIADDCSHIVTLHVDSFPIHPDWAEIMAGKLSETRPFAAPYYGNYTACLFFNRDFYLKHRPAFRLSAVDLSSQRYREFCKKFDHIPHAGVGYFFKAYSEGLSWHPLLESNKGNAHFVFISTIYDDVIFHLNAAAYSEKEMIADTSFIQVRKWGWRWFWVHVQRIILLSKIQQQLQGAVKRFVVPRHLLGQAWKHVGFPMFYKPIHCHERTQLLKNPESYLSYLRTGKKQKVI